MIFHRPNPLSGEVASSAAAMQVSQVEAIARRAAEHLKPCLLELGGKVPQIVLEDADLDEAVKAAAFGAHMNQCQICMSTEPIIVLSAVVDAFVERFAFKVRGLRTGDPRVE